MQDFAMCILDAKENKAWLSLPSNGLQSSGKGDIEHLIS